MQAGFCGPWYQELLSTAGRGRNQRPNRPGNEKNQRNPQRNNNKRHQRRRRRSPTFSFPVARRDGKRPKDAAAADRRRFLSPVRGGMGLAAQANKCQPLPGSRCIGQMPYIGDCANHPRTSMRGGARGEVKLQEVRLTRVDLLISMRVRCFSAGLGARRGNRRRARVCVCARVRVRVCAKELIRVYLCIYYIRG